MAEYLQQLRAKILGRLETPDGYLIASGGAEFSDDASGFFITERGWEMVPILPGQAAQIHSVAGVIAVWDLKVAAASRGLPRRYTFSHGVKGDGISAVPEVTPAERSRSSRTL